MLQEAPQETAKSETEIDDAVYCAGCGHLLTRTRWALIIGEEHERVFINPVGRVFRIACFIEAPGAADVGTPTDNDSWFPGYAWNFAICEGCGGHIGWRYVGETSPRAFFGLIKTALTASPGGGQG